MAGSSTHPSSKETASCERLPAHRQVITCECIWIVIDTATCAKLLGRDEVVHAVQKALAGRLLHTITRRPFQSPSSCNVATCVLVAGAIHFSPQMPRTRECCLLEHLRGAACVTLLRQRGS